MRLLSVCLLAVAAPLPTAAQTPWRTADPQYAWSFPRDHWAHPGYKTEWWYFTGIVTDAANPERRYGYQFTFFRVGLSPDSLPYRSAWSTPTLIMGHASVSDLTRGVHVFSEILYRPNNFLGGFGQPGDTLIAWSRAPYGTNDRWTLAWNGDGFDFAMRDDAKQVAFAMTTHATAPLLFQGPNGYSRKGATATAASQYYSYTRLATEGTVMIGGATMHVLGESWMDKEFGSNQLGAAQVGWDWFSLRLDDGRDVMLYLVRTERGPVYARGTIAIPGEDPRYVDASAWNVTVDDTWRSPATDATYPHEWSVAIPDLDLVLDIVPVLDDQENVSSLVPGLFYWEGAVVVRMPGGERLGEGYVELTGYGTTRRPAI
jgi:predicted secreted hydrolase